VKSGVLFGVFDLLHAGHLRYLQAARHYVGHLTVYVISDAVAAAYKRRPVIDERQRLELVAGLAVVDEALLADFRSHVDLENADHYIVSECLRGRPLSYVPDHRLDDVIYLPYSTEISTSEIIERCQGRLSDAVGTVSSQTCDRTEQWSVARKSGKTRQSREA
jgi:glycerol-3-phosphate cytidylyltransferase